MFGERHLDEEGTHVRKTWRAFFLRTQAMVPRSSTEFNSINYLSNDEAEVVFVRDGGFVRAPSFDGVPGVPGRRMLIPVNEQGELLDSNDAPDDQLHHTVVYVPPNFQTRIILFLFLMWFCGAVFCSSVTVLPREYHIFYGRSH